MLGRFHPRVERNLYGGALSAALHVALLFVLIGGGRGDGIHEDDAPSSMLVQVRVPESKLPNAAELPPLEDAAAPVADPLTEEQLEALLAKLAPSLSDPIAPQPARPKPPTVLPPQVPETIATVPAPSTIAMAQAEKAALVKYLEELVAESVEAARTEVTWEQDGRQYSAVLMREQASDGTDLERVVAEVSASDRGKHLMTRVNLNRLAFSHFTQMVDRWDPTVQLHDDEIGGRFHSNTRINMLYDSRTAPKLHGKVTTSARSFDAEVRGRRRDAEIFRGGLETRTRPINLPEELEPFEWAPRDADARIHEIASDARIRFYPNGSYTWRTRDSDETEYVSEPTEHPVYFLGARGVTLYVKGEIAGKVLIYSPHRIVIEGSLKYANDPREVPESADYLGLVCDRYVEVAPPSVTGRGDLEIDAAIFAGRRFVVTNIDYPRSGTLRIFGSLTAGTLSATEPRYATKIDYDARFERQRPPGFPATNRYEVDADWHGEWTQMN